MHGPEAWKALCFAPMLPTHACCLSVTLGRHCAWCGLRTADWRKRAAGRGRRTAGHWTAGVAVCCRETREVITCGSNDKSPRGWRWAAADPSCLSPAAGWGGGAGSRSSASLVTAFHFGHSLPGLPRWLGPWPCFFLAIVFVSPK
jgi:hypothetical protein